MSDNWGAEQWMILNVPPGGVCLYLSVALSKTQLAMKWVAWPMLSLRRACMRVGRRRKGRQAGARLAQVKLAEEVLVE